jgi:hypothetical protein
MPPGRPANDFDPAELLAAIGAAEARLTAPGVEDVVAAYLASAEGRSRPGPNQPGTLQEELHALDLYAEVPTRTKVRFGEAAVMQAVRQKVMFHCRPLEVQAAEWAAERAGDTDEPAPPLGSADSVIVTTRRVRRRKGIRRHGNTSV